MTAAPIRTRRHPGLIGVAAAAGGLALFVYFVARAGVDEVVAGIIRIGWAFVIVVALAGLRFVARALAWLRCMPAGHGFRLRDIMPAVLAGDALGNLTPLSLALGEPVKALYLRDRAPLGRTMPALAVETLFYTLSIVVVVAAGGVTLFVLVRPPAADSLITAVPLVTLAVLVTGLHWLMWNRIPLASGLLRALARLGIATTLLERAAARVLDIELRMHRDYPRDWSRVVVVAALHFSFHLLAIIEIFLVLSLISDRPPTVMDAFVLEAANRFINVVFKFVPMRVGVDEAGTALFADLLAYGATAGVTMAVVRKGRMLVWTAFGVVALVRRGLSLTELKARVGPGQGQGAVVAVMARAPLGTSVPKSRLSTTIPTESARRQLYAAFLGDTLAACRGLPGVAVRVAYAPEGGTDGFASVGLTKAELLAQRGSDLGARERGVFEDLFAAGYSKVLMIGSDLPTLPVEHIRDALARIGDAAVVLGPATDGGYYLMGLATPRDGEAIPNLFTDVRWSTSTTLEDTVNAAERAGITVAQMTPWYDVDDTEGLARLRQDLEQPEHATRAPATTRVLREILGRDPV